MKLVNDAPADELTADELKAKHPSLIVGNDCTIAAKNIRKELKQHFPGIKFSVICDRFSGGDSIDVSWRDGVTVAQIEAVINKYEAGRFNGSDDSYTYHHSTWKNTFGSSKYVSARRSESLEFVQLVLEWLALNRDKMGLNLVTPSAEDYMQGRLHTDDPWRLAIRLTLVHSVFAEGVAVFNVEANNE